MFSNRHKANSPTMCITKRKKYGCSLSDGEKTEVVNVFDESHSIMYKYAIKTLTRKKNVKYEIEI